MTDNTQTIKYRPDGSIDTAHYMAKGRHARSCQAHQLAGKSARASRAGVVAFFASLFSAPEPTPAKGNKAIRVSH